MARSKETSSKRENEERKRKKRKEKEEKKQERKSNSSKGKGFDSMIAYVDEMGRLSSTPPDPRQRTELKLEDIQLGAKIETEQDEQKFMNTGRVSFYSPEKGYGFIKDKQTKESIFFHLSSLKTEVKINDLVSYDKAKGQRGPTATSVTKIE
jgi:cold shock CspA family protein